MCIHFFIHLPLLTTPPTPPPLSGRTCSALLFSDFVEEKTKEIIRKTAVLLV
jgi:hypothetical protein